MFEPCLTWKKEIPLQIKQNKTTWPHHKPISLYRLAAARGTVKATHQWIFVDVSFEMSQIHPVLATAQPCPAPSLLVTGVPADPWSCGGFWAESSALVTNCCVLSVLLMVATVGLPWNPAHAWALWCDVIAFGDAIEFTLTTLVI